MILLLLLLFYGILIMVCTTIIYCVLMIMSWVLDGLFGGTHNRGS